ncbi:MAG: hypothetical protein Q8P16_01820, partial [bacterium]|nr:hypothetical protein [bacterium]
MSSEHPNSEGSESQPYPEVSGMLAAISKFIETPQGRGIIVWYTLPEAGVFHLATSASDPKFGTLLKHVGEVIDSTNKKLQRADKPYRFKLIYPTEDKFGIR